MRQDIMLGVLVSAFILAIAFGMKAVAKKSFAVNL